MDAYKQTMDGSFRSRVFINNKQDFASCQHVIYMIHISSALGVLFVLLILQLGYLDVCLFLDMSAWLVGSSDRLYLISPFLFSPNFLIATKVGLSI